MEFIFVFDLNIIEDFNSSKKFSAQSENLLIFFKPNSFEQNALLPPNTIYSNAL